jgi:hypothetical protein
LTILDRGDCDLTDLSTVILSSLIEETPLVSLQIGCREAQHSKNRFTYSGLFSIIKASLNSNYMSCLGFAGINSYKQKSNQSL